MSNVGATKSKAHTGVGSRGPRVPEVIVREVWARAGGICSFPSCDRVLYRDAALGGKSVQFGEVAHNVAASPGGERGDPNRSRALSHDPDNLILLCPTHHTLIDRRGAATDYPDSLLAEWKQRHEAAIRVAGTLTGRTGHALVFQGAIGGQPIALDPSTIPHAMLQQGLVLEQNPTVIKIDVNGHTPKSASYWNAALAQVRHQVGMVQSTLGHRQQPLAIFALADMPTLMALGFAFGHTASVSVFQFNPLALGGDWRFPDPSALAPNFQVSWPTSVQGEIALVISLSGPIEHSRVRAPFATSSCSIIEISVEQPTTDLILGPAAIEAFARTLRSVVARLEGLCPKTTPIHVFPAMPASLAVTFGRFVKPKVSFPFRIYDAQGRDAPFEYAVSIPFLDAADGD